MPSYGDANLVVSWQRMYKCMEHSDSILAAHTCGLCLQQNASVLHHNRQPPNADRLFLKCAYCGLIQVPEAHRISLTAEKAEYDLHQNNPSDPGYRKFLQRFLVPLAARLEQAQSAQRERQLSGLDFGCGPGPALSVMLNELGYVCVDYDLFYANEQSLLHAQYDFITATEVFEHLAHPANVLDTLLGCLKPGGLLALMMQRPDEQPNFANWGYIKDPTHISFYTNQALRFIADRWLLTQVYRDRNVLIWRKR